MTDIAFRPRWREELEANAPAGRLVFELTMGQRHVYFPDRTRWSQLAPAWAAHRWQEYATACEAWCRAQRIPFSFAGDANFYQEAVVPPPPAAAVGLCAELAPLLAAELAAGNRVGATGPAMADPSRPQVVLRGPFRTLAAELPPAIERHAVDDPHWWGEELRCRTHGDVLACGCR